MNENRPTTAVPMHEITLKGRTRMSITGVREVISFDDSTVELLTDCGELTVEGEGLHIGTLDTERGVVLIDGTSVDGLFYPTAANTRSRGLFGKWRK